MPIPTDWDRKLGDIDMQARSIVAQLTSIHWCGAPKDKDRMRMTLRERLQSFCDDVLSAAHD
jgi:hypothetical protein